MIVLGAVLLSIIGSYLLYKIYPKDVVWWELAIPPVATLVVILILKFSIELYSISYLKQNSDLTESTTYYESWNEYIHRMCTKTVSCGKDCTTTVVYDCSYVKTHPPYHTIESLNGNTFVVSESEYIRLKNQFGNSTFVDMRRDYHTKDGDAYRSIWDGSIEKSNAIFWSTPYENRVKASSGSIFNYQDVDTNDVKKFQLYEYPSISSNYTSPVILYHPTVKLNANDVKYLEYVAASIGNSTDVRLLILLFKNQPIEASYYQEWYWKGSNFNDFILTVGVNDTLGVEWSRVISWTENEQLKSSTQNFIAGMGIFNIQSVYSYLQTELPNFKPRSSEYFKYIPIEIPASAIVVIYIFAIILNIGVAWWVVNNEIS